MNGTPLQVVDRAASINWFRETRRRTTDLFGLLTPEAYYEQPIPLRHPVVFYEGHIPAFSVNTLLKRGLGVEVLVELAAPGATAPATQVETRQKPIRLIDERD